MTKKKKIAVIIASVLVLLLAIDFGGGLFMVHYALCPAQTSTEDAEAKMRKHYQMLNPWLDSLQLHKALKDTFILAEDGARLHALYAKAQTPTPKTAVIIHGYTNQAVQMLHIGYLYHHDLHYNILLPDLRYAGQTEGKAIQMGWKDREDVMKWLDAAPAVFGKDLEVVVHGISMGGATTMMTSGEKLPAYVKCFVDDCGYTSVWDQFAKELKGQFGLPKFPLLHTASMFCQLKYGWNFKEASSMEQVKKCELPMLFIHGDEDDYVPTWMVYDLYEAKSEPKELWVTKGVGHADSYLRYPEEYTRRVKEFTDQYIGENALKERPAQHFHDLAADRFSCRKMSERPVEEELIKKIIETAILAPTAANRQPIRIFWLQSEKAKNALAQTTDFLFGAETFLVLGCQKDQGWIRPSDQQAFAAIDAGIVGTHIMMEVQDLGLATTWVGHFDAPLLKELCPEMKDYDLMAMFPIGYAADNAIPSASHFKRKSMEDMLMTL